MSGPAIVTASPADRDRCLDALARAFVADPFNRWMLPDPERYRRVFPRLALCLGGAAFEHGSAWRSEDCKGVALWLPPGVRPDDEGLGAIVEQDISRDIHADLFALGERLAAVHPVVDHWYLAIIGVEPMERGKGYGTALIEHGLAICDAAREPVRLEATSPINIPIYERFGFEVTDRIEVGDCPAITPMFRAAR